MYNQYYWQYKYLVLTIILKRNDNIDVLMTSIEKYLYFSKSTIHSTVIYSVPIVNCKYYWWFHISSILLTVNAALLLCLFTGELITSNVRISYLFNLLHCSTNMDEFFDDMLTEDIVGEDENT